MEVWFWVPVHSSNLASQAAIYRFESLIYIGLEFKKKPLLHEAITALVWRRDPESNWARRICNPLHNRFAIAPFSKKKGKQMLPFLYWSGKRGSNSRPIPWQGIALPTELLPHKQKKLTPSVNGAGKEARTLDLYLGKVSLYQLSYSRKY